MSPLNHRKRGSSPTNVESIEEALSRRPDESAISEGNLAENPLFVLSSKEARPTDSEGKIRLADYSRTLEVSSERVDGSTLERSVTLKANPQFGYPTMFAYRLLLAIFGEAHKTAFRSPVVYISRYELAQRLGIKRPSQSNYKDIHNALEAMRSLTITFRNSWHDKASSSRAGEYSSDGLIANFSFRDERQADLPFDGQVDGTPERRSYVKLADLLFGSLKQNYLHGVDLDYVNALKSPLAQRLYAYLTKKDGTQTQYKEGLKLLASKLNLKNRSPFHIKKALEPALRLLREATVVDEKKPPRRFLDAFWFDNERQTLTVVFYSPQREVLDSELAKRPMTAPASPWGPSR